MSSHADELETSAYLAIDPGAVDMSQAVRDTTFRRSPHVWGDLAGLGARTPNSKSPLVRMFEHFSTGSISGVRGDPTTAARPRRAGAAARSGGQGAGRDRRRAGGGQIVPPTDHHEADVEALKRHAAAAGTR